MHYKRNVLQHAMSAQTVINKSQFIYHGVRLSHESLQTQDTCADNQNAEETSALKKQYCSDPMVTTLLLPKLPI